MAHFEDLPGEIRLQVYRLLFSPSGHTLFPISYKPLHVRTLHPAILRVSRHILAEAAAVLYGDIQYVFQNNQFVRSLLEWFKIVGNQNLQRIRAVTVYLVDYFIALDPVTQALASDNNKLFTKCLRIITAQCSGLQKLNVFGDGLVRDGTACVDHVLILTRMVGLRKLTLWAWTHLEAADQFVKLLGLRERSEVEFWTTASEGGVPEDHDHWFDVKVQLISVEDEIAVDRAARSWAEFDKAVAKELGSY